MTNTIIIIVVVAALAGLLPAFIAQLKGKSFVRWWVYGVFLFPVALVHALSIGMGAILQTKRCGYCRSMVRMDAPHCPRCGYEFIDWS